MLITIRSTWLLHLFGWRTYPSYVIASHKLWWKWLWQKQNMELHYVKKRTENLTDPNTGTGQIPIAQLVNLALTRKSPFDKQNKEAIMAENKNRQIEENEDLENIDDLVDFDNDEDFDDDEEDFTDPEVETLEAETPEGDLEIPDSLDRRGKVSYFQDDDADTK
jgi:hypothetical protein